MLSARSDCSLPNGIQHAHVVNVIELRTIMLYFLVTGYNDAGITYPADMISSAFFQSMLRFTACTAVVGCQSSFTMRIHHGLNDYSYVHVALLNEYV